MTRDTEFLGEIYEQMHKKGLVQTKAEFSTQMLGKGPSYLTSMSARDRTVPDEVMVFLINQVTAGIEDDDAAIFILSEQREQRRRDQLHRNDLLSWISRHQALPMDDRITVSAEQGRSMIGSSWRQRLSCWLSRRLVAMS